MQLLNLLHSRLALSRLALLPGSLLLRCSLRRAGGLSLLGTAPGKGWRRLARRHHFVGDVAENEAGEETDE